MEINNRISGTYSLQQVFMPDSLHIQTTSLNMAAVLALYRSQVLCCEKLRPTALSTKTCGNDSLALNHPGRD